jgi:hypothetical protein
VHITDHCSSAYVSDCEVPDPFKIGTSDKAANLAGKASTHAVLLCSLQPQHEMAVQLSA